MEDTATFAKKLRHRAGERRKILEHDILAVVFDELADILENKPIDLTQFRSDEE